MLDPVTIVVTGRHASIEDLRWDNVPPLAVVTGLNGAGKSQLLEVLAHSFDALPHAREERPAVDIRATAQIEGDEYSRGEVFHSYGEWKPLTSSPASDDDIRNAIHTLQAGRRTEDVLRSLSADLDLTIAQLRDFTPSQLLRVLTPGLLWTYGPEQYHSLSALFMAYRYLERTGLESDESPEELRARLGEPPWQLLSSIITAAGLPFTINHPQQLPHTRSRLSTKFEFELRDSHNNVVPLEQLSSGERVLMATATWRYEAEIAGRHFRLLLLDEPDAHLHPSLTRRFLNVVREVFVEQRDVRVIMTTHSPSTVALTPDGSLFAMQRTDPRLRPVSRAEAIATLTGGFVAVQDATRTVLLEGKEDPPFYRQVWQLLIEPVTPAQSGAIDTYPNINFMHGQGRQTVQALVAQLRQAGFTNFYGLIDKDKGNIPTDGVFVLSRYAIENYLYDPLNVWLAANRMRRVKEFGLYSPISLSVFRDLPVSELQAMLDSVVHRVDGLFPSSDVTTARVNVEHHNGITLSYPQWCLTLDKAEIKRRFSKALTQFTTRDLLEAYVELNFVPVDLLHLYRAIQRQPH